MPKSTTLGMISLLAGKAVADLLPAEQLAKSLSPVDLSDVNRLKVPYSTTSTAQPFKTEKPHPKKPQKPKDMDGRASAAMVITGMIFATLANSCANEAAPVKTSNKKNFFKTENKLAKHRPVTKSHDKRAYQSAPRCR